MQEASATEISERAGAIAADAQADLDKALPALAAAVQCLKELKKAHIDEVKALKKPPGGVRLTLEVACVFFEVAPVKKPDPEDPSKKVLDYVEPAGKSLLSNAGKFLEMLQEFDKDNIPDKVRDSALKFPSISQLELRMPHRRDAVDATLRAGHQEGRPLHREPRLHAQGDRKSVRRVQGHLHVVRRGAGNGLELDPVEALASTRSHESPRVA